MPTLATGPVAVSVPATSANLGPGFDCLGLALGLRDRLVAEPLPAGSPSVVEIEGEGAAALPRDERHLVLRVIATAFEAMDVAPQGVRLHCQNVVPQARGLGSSSAAIVGGLALARALVEDGADRLDDQALFTLAASIEGHPDNVAPACFGGFVISGHDDGAWWAVPAPVDHQVSTVVLVPPDGVETQLARGLLPTHVTHPVAAADAGRAAVLVAALGGRLDQLHRGTRDHLHQEHRRPAMPATIDLVDALRDDGVAAAVSGAGPTVLALVTDDVQAGLVRGRAPRGWVAWHLPVDPRGLVVEGPPTRAVIH